MVTITRVWRGFSGVNKLISVLILLLGLFLLFSIVDYRGWQRQYWTGVVIGDPNDEGRIDLIEAYLVPANGQRMELKDSYNNYWSFDNSQLTAAFQLPPRQLSAIWASLLERRFYQGIFDVPTHRVDSVFSLIEQHPDWANAFEHKGLRYAIGYEKYGNDSIPGPVMVVRLGQGGRVGLWLAGRDTLHTVWVGDFKGQAFQPLWGEPPFAGHKDSATYWRQYQPDLEK